MSDRLDPLSNVQVLALDCQASGATPAYGDLLELGWGVCSVADRDTPVRSHWIKPRTERPIGRPVRELTGWSEACLCEAVEEQAAWSALANECSSLEPRGEATVPTVIHFARFELGFLRDLHERVAGDTEFPFDAVCLHAVAQRLFPDLPRRNIRAVAGYLGHSPELVRRAAGHVEATAFIWRALVPMLENEGIATWTDLKGWLEARPSVRRSRRIYPLAAERRRALPAAPGVYRFLRRNGDVLYVGKAISLKKRVASHFKRSAKTTERALELLTQAHDVAHTETASVLEAALLEADEIQRLDPPYNVQLRAGDACAWFASRDFRSAASRPDAAHPLGPLPSERALDPLAALIALVGGEPPTAALAARALAVPLVFAPPHPLFADGFEAFSLEHFGASNESPARRVARASLAIWLVRGRAEPEASPDDASPDAWDLARVLRRLDRSLVQSGLLARRARWLSLLGNARVGFREPGMDHARGLVMANAAIVEQKSLAAVTEIFDASARRAPPSRERQACFDRAAYDRMRVLLTELRRIRDGGGEIALQIGRRLVTGERLAALLRAV